MYYTQEQIDRANQADLVSFLQSQGEQLTRAGNEYRWKRHDSLTVRGNKWYRHSQSRRIRHHRRRTAVRRGREHRHQDRASRKADT